MKKKEIYKIGNRYQNLKGHCQKRKKDKSNIRFAYGDIIAIIVLIAVSIMAWLMKPIITEHVSVSLFGVFITCAITNATVLLPSSSLMIVLEYAMIINPFMVAFSGALGAASGEMVGFLVGRKGKKIVKSNVTEKIRKKFSKHPYRWIIIFAVIPIPVFDAIGMAAGMSDIRPWKFYIVCILGKWIKMFSYVMAFRLLIWMF